MSKAAPQQLVILYQKLADLTAPECGQCRTPYSCCSLEYCEAAETYAAEEFDIALTLETTPNPKGLLFLGEKGCTVPPYLRPTCTMHTCDINSLGFKRNDPAWTKNYLKLRESIEAAQWDFETSKEAEE
jgi:hypothetical protein